MDKLMFSVFKKGVKFLSGKGIGKLPSVMKAYDSLYQHLKPDDILLIDTLLGHKMYVNPQDDISKSLIMHGSYERYTTELFKKCLEKGMVVVDIGAHIGYYTLIAADIVGESGKVFAFEPDPYNYSLLIKNVEVNGYKNIIPIQKAVSNKVGITRLFLFLGASGWHSIYEVPGWRKSIEIETVTLDEFFENEKIGIIKMDAEGAEMAILQGMKKQIEKNDKLKIFAEFNPLLLKVAGYSPEEYLHKFISYGFKLFDINERKKEIEPVGSVDTFVQAYLEGEVTNLLCLKVE